MDIAALRKRDADLYARLPAFMLKGEHLVLANAMFHPGRIMNELNAMNFIIDHESEPFCLKTICDIYAALTEGTEFEGKSFKKRNVFVSDKNRKYLFVTAAAEDTPAEMERICKEFRHLDNPGDENLDDMLRFILMLMLIHPFEDGNGRFASVVLQFLMQKAHFRCAPFIPVDYLRYGYQMNLFAKHIVYASGAFYGHRPVRFDRFVPYMWDVIDNAYGFLEKAVKRCEISASRN